MIVESTPVDERTQLDDPSPQEKKRLMEQAQEDAAHEREISGGYQ